MLRLRNVPQIKRTKFQWMRVHNSPLSFCMSNNRPCKGDLNSTFTASIAAFLSPVCTGEREGEREGEGREEEGRVGDTNRWQLTVCTVSQFIVHPVPDPSVCEDTLPCLFASPLPACLCTLP